MSHWWWGFFARGQELATACAWLAFGLVGEGCELLTSVDERSVVAHVLLHVLMVFTGVVMVVGVFRPLWMLSGWVVSLISSLVLLVLSIGDVPIVAVTWLLFGVLSFSQVVRRWYEPCSCDC